MPPWLRAGCAATRSTAALELVLAADSIVVCWAMGITQHRNAVATIREIVNFALLRGNIGRPGAGLCPVRGHSNVQGDRTMGIYEKPSPAFLDAARCASSASSRHADHGHDTVDTIRAMRDGRVKAFVAMGGNFAAAAPDTEATDAALRRCDLTVQVSTKLNRSHVECRPHGGDPPVPRAHRARRAVRRAAVRHRRGLDGRGAPLRGPPRTGGARPPERGGDRVPAGRRAPPGGRRSTGTALERDYDRIRDHIEAVVPGFEPLQRAGARARRLRAAARPRETSGRSPRRPAGPASP